MSWIIPDIDALVTRRKLSQQELTAIASKGLQSGDTADEALARVREDIVAHVRAKVRAGKYELGPDGTIPSSLYGAMLDLWVIEFLTTLPGLKSLISDERRAAKTEALKRLDDVAKGLEAVDPTDAPAAEQPVVTGGGATLISAGNGSATHAKTNGLF